MERQPETQIDPSVLEPAEGGAQEAQDRQGIPDTTSVQQQIASGDLPMRNVRSNRDALSRAVTTVDAQGRTVKILPTVFTDARRASLDNTKISGGTGSGRGQYRSRSIDNSYKRV